MSDLPLPSPASAQQANAEGMAAMSAGNYTAAAIAFSRAAMADPGALPLWSNLAHAHRLADNTAGERAALDSALAIDRVDFGAQLRMAQLLQRIGEETAAFIAWAGVQQLAARLPIVAPQVKRELEAGRLYCEELQTRLYARVDQALAPSSVDWGQAEERRIRAFVGSAMGLRRVFHNQCAGVFYPFLPEDEYFDRLHFPWLDQLEMHHGAIKQELQALLEEPGDALRPYVKMEEGTPQNDWSKLDGSLDWGACFLWEYGVPNAPVIDRCPQTATLLESLPLARIAGRAPNAFFSILQPHSHIPPHTGVTNTRVTIHFGLDVPAGCGFRVGNETREWTEGKAFAFDDTIEHEAWNSSNRLRAILIIDAWNPHLSERERSAICDYFAASDAALAG